MRHPSQPHDDVPAVRSVPELGAGTLGEADITTVGGHRRARAANPEHGRQRLRCPENGLRVEGLVRVSCEKKAPIAVETCGSPWHELRRSAVCDNASDNRHRDEGTPRRNRLLRQPAFQCRLRAIANQTSTSNYSSHAFKTKIAAREPHLFWVAQSADYPHSELTTRTGHTVDFSSRQASIFLSNNIHVFLSFSTLPVAMVVARWHLPLSRAGCCRTHRERDQGAGSGSGSPSNETRGFVSAGVAGFGAGKTHNQMFLVTCRQS
jgi:hypothetical protein